VASCAAPSRHARPYGHARGWDAVLAALVALVVLVAVLWAVWPRHHAPAFPVPTRGCVSWQHGQGIACVEVA